VVGRWGAAAAAAAGPAAAVAIVVFGSSPVSLLHVVATAIVDSDVIGCGCGQIISIAH